MGSFRTAGRWPCRIRSVQKGSVMKVPLLDLKAEYAELREEILAALDRVCQRSAFVLGEEVEALKLLVPVYWAVSESVT